MAKALFHKSQRVFVKPVGTWATVEHVVPHWVKDVNEPLRVTYDCGLGRAHDFRRALYGPNRRLPRGLLEGRLRPEPRDGRYDPTALESRAAA